MSIKSPKIPPPSHQGIAQAKLILARFSIGIFFIITIAIIVIGQVDNKLTESVRMRVIDRLVPMLDVMGLPVDYVMHIGEKISALWALQSENKLLQEENIKLRNHYTSLQHIQQENDELRRLLKVVKEPAASFITARVVGDVSGPYVRSALINAGTLKGVKKNQIVINDQGVVGHIIETGEKSARILLLTDFNSKIPVITSESRERCIAAGDNSDAIKIIYLPGRNKITVGEQVLTSGDGDMFPANLLVGTIYAVTDKGFYIKPAVEWDRLGYVQVISN